MLDVCAMCRFPYARVPGNGVKRAASARYLFDRCSRRPWGLESSLAIYRRLGVCVLRKFRRYHDDRVYLEGAVMMLRSRDFLLATMSRRLEPLLRDLSKLEMRLFAKNLRETAIDRPVFVMGLARSGTTMLLTLLSKAHGVATHRYRDFTFLTFPILWNRFQSLSRGQDEPVERPHGDRIHITRDSPEAFEEPIWQAFFPWTHDESRCHILDSGVDALEFEAFFVTTYARSYGSAMVNAMCRKEITTWAGLPF